MRGLNWDLNLHPDLQAASRRLSFSDADSPSSGRRGSMQMGPSRPLSRLGTIDENSPLEMTQAPSSLGTTGALYPAPGGTPTSTAGAPVATSLSLAPPGPLQSQQPQEQRRQAELRASFGLYQQQHQQALATEAGLQQAWAAAAAERLQSQVLRLYTVDGGAAGYETKWEELHPVSQGLLLRIE